MGIRRHVLTAIEKSSGDKADTIAFLRHLCLKDLAELNGRNVIVYYSGGLDRQSMRNEHAIKLNGRNVIVYYSGGLDRQSMRNEHAINDNDTMAFDEVAGDLGGDELDLILHSQGGSVDAASAIVDYLRSQFKDVRVFVPHLALSAATMIACSSNRLVMGRHSFLGPIDPQLFFTHNDSVYQVAAKAVIEEFDMFLKNKNTAVNQHRLNELLLKYQPGQYQKCKSQVAHTKDIVSDWLCEYMFSGERNPRPKVNRICNSLINKYKSHGAHISRDATSKLGLIVDNLESLKAEEELVKSIYYCCQLYVRNVSQMCKIIQNHEGDVEYSFT